jgi:phosphoglycolate phosphatase
MNEPDMNQGLVSIINTVLFDLDGTLVDSADDIIDCLSQAYAAASFCSMPRIEKSFIGPPLQAIIQSVSPGLGVGEVEQIVKNFRSFYDLSALNKTVFKKNVRETLLSLKARNKLLFVVTNKPFIPVKKIIKKLNIDFFCDIMTPDIKSGFSFTKSEMVSFLKQKWKLNAETTLMVGDTASDVYAAREHDIASAIVLNGYGDRDSILKSRPEYVVDNFYELNKLFLS